MKTIRLLKNVIGGDGEPLKEGSLHSLNDASANHWLKRGLAVEEKAEETASDATPRRRKQNKG
ncbi:hypothetical protein SAMN05216404_106161 [Nitrosospira multiformis]|uniref:Uncharacterized protein n=1 Tax=Nitrosospira multiformis TaxID=1231 RepID=A0A1H8IT95_9PROT|nr:hypothetical protein [Nitrosospira multiformis]SEN71216.1 hypothetical protein SAMN05216404_106161 [Nitrosospira multiformis]